LQDDIQGLHDDLHEEVMEIYEDHGWDAGAEDKDDVQLIADQILTLLSFVAADGSWGMHNPEYAEVLLEESEDLLDDLLDEIE